MSQLRPESLRLDMDSLDSNHENHLGIKTPCSHVYAGQVPGHDVRLLLAIDKLLLELVRPGTPTIPRPSILRLADQRHHGYFAGVSSIH
jgi:hypothetical protein